MTLLDVDGRKVVLSNLDKVLWPSPGVTKGQLLDYYAALAPTLLPHLRGRPVTVSSLSRRRRRHQLAPERMPR